MDELERNQETFWVGNVSWTCFPCHAFVYGVEDDQNHPCFSLWFSTCPSLSPYRFSVCMDQAHGTFDFCGGGGAFDGNAITTMRMHAGKVLKNQISSRTVGQLRDILQNNPNLLEVPSGRSYPFGGGFIPSPFICQPDSSHYTRR